MSTTVCRAKMSPKLCLHAEWQGQLYEVKKLQTSCPDKVSAMAMVYCLFQLVRRVVLFHKTITALAGLRAVANTAPADESTSRGVQDIAAAADLAAAKIGLAWEMLGMHQD